MECLAEIREGIRDSLLIRIVLWGLILFSWIFTVVMVLAILSDQTQISVLILTGTAGAMAIALIPALIILLQECCRKTKELPRPQGQPVPVDLEAGGESFEQSNPLHR